MNNASTINHCFLTVPAVFSFQFSEGYDEGGQLTDAVRRRPYSVLLFDEMEKVNNVHALSTLLVLLLCFNFCNYLNSFVLAPYIGAPRCTQYHATTA